MARASSVTLHFLMKVVCMSDPSPAHTSQPMPILRRAADMARRAWKAISELFSFRKHKGSPGEERERLLDGQAQPRGAIRRNSTEHTIEVSPGFRALNAGYKPNLAAIGANAIGTDAGQQRYKQHRPSALVQPGDRSIDAWLRGQPMEHAPLIDQPKYRPPGTPYVRENPGGWNHAEGAENHTGRVKKTAQTRAAVGQRPTTRPSTPYPQSSASPGHMANHSHAMPPGIREKVFQTPGASQRHHGQSANRGHRMS